MHRTLILTSDLAGSILPDLAGSPLEVRKACNTHLARMRALLRELAGSLLRDLAGSLSLDLAGSPNSYVSNT